MPGFLFWNTNRHPVEQALARLAHRHNADVVVLAEDSLSESQMIEFLNAGGSMKFTRPPSRSDRLKFYVRDSVESFESVTDATGIAIRRLRMRDGDDLLIVAVHLPSKMRASNDDQNFLIVELARAISEAESRVGHGRTIVIGDFNMDPFQPGMVAASGLHSVMDRRVVVRGSRKVGLREYGFFYNPMWSLYGDLAGRPGGTYFYDKGHMVSYFWHMFDQVLLRPSLLERFDHDSLCIITSDGVKSLGDSQGRPDRGHASDHFPIGFRLKEQRQVTK